MIACRQQQARIRTPYILMIKHYPKILISGHGSQKKFGYSRTRSIITNSANIAITGQVLTKHNSTYKYSLAVIMGSWYHEYLELYRAKNFLASPTPNS